MSSPFLLALTVTSIAILPAGLDAQGRTASPRPPAGGPGPGHSVGVVHPVGVAPASTVFINGYYYPALYHPAWYNNIAIGVGFGYGYGPYPYYGSPYYFGAPYGPYGWPYYYGPTAYDISGSVRLQVTQRDAQVFVDGYYAGLVDDFDGTFQRLHAEPGEHEITIHLTGHRAIQQRVYLQPGKTFSIKQDLAPLAPGETESPLPTPAPRPVPVVRQGEPSADPQESRRPEPQARESREAGRAGAPAEGFGALALRVQPSDANVTIDGEPWRGSLESGGLVVQLGAGTHHIEIRREGYRSYFTDVTLESGQSRTLNVVLNKQ